MRNAKLYASKRAMNLPLLPKPAFWYWRNVISVASEEMGVPTAPTLVPKAMPTQSFEKWLMRIALGTLLIT